MKWDRDQERKAGKAAYIGFSVFGLLFLCLWCAVVMKIGAWFMLLFAIPMVGILIYRLYLGLRNGKDDPKRNQSKEADPWGRSPVQPPKLEDAAKRGRFCPYCGSGIEEAFTFCPTCGRRQPNQETPNEA